MGEHSRPGPVDQGTGTLTLLLAGTALTGLLGRLETGAPHGGRD